MDDFCKVFGDSWKKTLIESGQKKRDRKTRLSMSEIMTIIVYFHLSGYKTFKDYYTRHVMVNLRSAFPDLVAYSRFVYLMKGAIIPLCVYLSLRKGTVTGISFIDSTPIRVCHTRRIHSHRVFKGLAQRGKNSMGWFYGFKLHLIINDMGELLDFRLTPGNVDDRVPVPKMTEDIFGKLFGDKGYLSQKLFEQLLEQGVQLITRLKKNMKNKLMPLFDKILLRKRALIETINDLLKNISMIEHTRHRSPFNFMVNLLGGLIAYTYNPKKPSLNIKFNNTPEGILLA